MDDKNTSEDNKSADTAGSEHCPKCGKPLSEVITTKTGRQLRRCTGGEWNEQTRQVEGCDYVKWIIPPPEELDEKCPKCGEPVVMAMTRFGKKLKKCSTNKWDPQTRSATGCDWVEWVKGTTEPLDEKCPKCGENLVLYTTANGKKLKKCSTNKWNADQGIAEGCDFVSWIN